MTYKSYMARIEFDGRDDIFWGKVLGLADKISITFHGEAVAELRRDFENAVDDYSNDWHRADKEASCPRTTPRFGAPALGRPLAQVAQGETIPLSDQGPSVSDG